MNRFKIYFSNRLEVLSKKLSEIVSSPLSDPFSKETIIVQSGGMSRWISMVLAEQNGICANSEFLFPNNFLHKYFSEIFPEIKDSDFFSSDNMTFGIMQLLPELVRLKEFEIIKTYLEDDDNNVKLYQLSGKIADTFDQYLVFRPELIASWEINNSGYKGDDAWQALLWKQLVELHPQPHRARLRKLLIEKIKAGNFNFNTFPERISIFGISHLPPFHIETFAAVSSKIPVNLFVLNPCMEYWGDILTKKELKRIENRHTNDSEASTDLYLTRGNRLLSSMGAAGRDFIDMLTEYDYESEDLYESKPPDSMLSFIQSDILFLTEIEKKTDRHLVSVDDNTIQIHSCHSPMRETEVLYDYLLDMFEKDGTLKPEDIIVMAPDIGQYSPYVQAVFDVRGDKAKRIPFNIADQQLKGGSHIIDGFLYLFDLKNSRLTAPQVLGLFDYPGIRKKFAFNESEIIKISRWVENTSIRWGIDPDSRIKAGLPGYSENTWQAGIDRMLLGYALPGNREYIYDGILPFDNIEGEDTEILGRFLTLLKSLFRFLSEIEKPHALMKWTKILASLLDDFFESGEDNAREIQALRTIIHSLSLKSEITGYHAPVYGDVIRMFLDESLMQEGFRSGFISGGVTFCSMLPMRSIPAKKICLMGMNSNSFPRESYVPGFDLIAKNPKRGDRSRRDDDKYLFLEAILSAREQLYISYVGQSIQDNSIIPPSVLVSELIDTLDTTLVCDDAGTLMDQIFYHHKLQPFSPDYFTKDGKLFSYSTENYEACQHLESKTDYLPFISSNLVKPEHKQNQVIDIDDLLSFLKNPSRFLLEGRLGVYLNDDAQVFAESELFQLSGLDKYKVDQDVLKIIATKSDSDRHYEIKRAEGELPHGHIGKLAYNRSISDAEKFYRTCHKFIGGKDKIESIEFELDIEGLILKGNIGPVFDNSIVHIGFKKMKTVDLLKLWLHHLVYGAICENERQITNPGFIICKDVSWFFKPLENSKDYLKYLLKIFIDGLSSVVPFFPETSMAYAIDYIEKNRSHADALKSAVLKWNGNEFVRGESHDAYFQLCFERAEPLGNSFCETAVLILEPVLKNRNKVHDKI